MHLNITQHFLKTEKDVWPLDRWEKWIAPHNGSRANDWGLVNSVRPLTGCVLLRVMNYGLKQPSQLCNLRLKEQSGQTF